jgi:hypothetical protein
MLFRYLQQRDRLKLPPPFLFPALSGGKWGQRNALRSYYLLQAKLRLPSKSRFHRLRHTFSTEYLRAGGDVGRLSRILGHSHISTRMRYVHLLTDDRQRPHQGFVDLESVAMTFRLFRVFLGLADGPESLPPPGSARSTGQLYCSTSTTRTHDEKVS